MLAFDPKQTFSAQDWCAANCPWPHSALHEALDRPNVSRTNPAGLAVETAPKAENTVLRGSATILGSGVFELQGVAVRLLDVDSVNHRDLRALRNAIWRRELICTPAESKGFYNYRVDNVNFSATAVPTGEQFSTKNPNADPPGAEEQDHTIHKLRRHAFGRFGLRQFFAR